MMEKDIRDRLLRLDTCSLSDALDRLRIEGQAVGILAQQTGVRIAGPAFTVRMLPRGLSGKSVGDYVDEVPNGHVVVIDNAGRMDTTVWGDILTTKAGISGIAGTVIDGVNRDSAVSRERVYPIFARGNTMRTGKDRVAAEEYQGPVQVCGVRVEAGDWIVGDDDGVVVVPASRLDEVLRVAEEVERVEAGIRSAIEDGETLSNVRTRTNYHRLQSSEN